jgi:hypothetical protein
MNISSLTSRLLTSLTSKNPSKSSSSVSSTEAMPAAPDQAGISKGGELMKQLSELAQSDPEKFKRVAANIADQLKELADTQTGEAKSHLTDMASSFEAASKSGSMEDLKPKGPPPQGPPPRGAEAYAQNQSQAQGTDIRSQIDVILESALSSISG